MPLNFSDGDFLSSTVLNNATIHKMTGTEMIALTSAQLIPGFLIYCTANAAPYTIGTLYKRNQDNTQFEIVGLENHTHISSITGGSLSSIRLANIPVSLEYNRRSAKAAEFYSTTASGGTVADDSTLGAIRLQTSTTSGGTAAIFSGYSRKMTFAQASAFEVTLQMSSSTNFQVKLGIFADAIGTSATPAKYGIEGCSSSGTTWLVFSANGTTRSTTTTSANVATGTTNVYRVEHTPGADVKFYVDGTLAATKTTNVPSSGTTTNALLYRAEVKNTAAENKILDCYGGPIIEGSVG